MRKWILAAVAAVGLSGEADAALYEFRAFSHAGGWMDGGFFIDDSLIFAARDGGLEVAAISAADILGFWFRDKKANVNYGPEDVLPAAIVNIKVANKRPILAAFSGPIATEGAYTISFTTSSVISDGPKGGTANALWFAAHRNYDLSTIPIPASGLALLAGIGFLGALRRRPLITGPGWPRRSSHLHSTR